MHTQSTILRNAVEALLREHEYDTLHEALAEAIRRRLGPEDVAAWHNYDLTPLTAAAVDLADKAGGEIRIWGDGVMEPISVTI